MSLDAIKKINETEEKMRALKSQAEAEAKSAAETAKSKGEAAVRASIEQGNKEVLELFKNTEAKARKLTEELMSKTENKKAVIMAHAEANLDRAATYIIERIVKG